MKLKKHINTRLLTLTVLTLTFLACKKNIPVSEIIENFTDKVYPLLDTENSRWFFFSSASRPFGMVNLSPDTKIEGAWGSGYRHEVDTIKSFSHIHAWQISGLSVMPVTVSNEKSDIIFADFYVCFFGRRSRSLIEY